MIALLGACLVLGPSAAAQAADEVDWTQPPFKNILKTAKQENKHVFIDFYTTWCGPCKMLDKVTYQDSKVVEYLNSIVAVKYDAEKNEGEELAKKFRVKAYPTLVLLGPDGKEVDRHIGYLDADGFMKTIKGYQDGIGTVTYYEELLEKNPEDTDALYALGVKHADAVRSKEAEAAFEKLLKIDPDNENKAEIYYQLGYTMNADDRNEDAIEYFDKVITEYPDAEVHDQALQMQARAYFALDKKDKSLESYQALLARHPDDPRMMNGFAWFCAQRKFGFDQALPVALKAAELSDRDPGILDTLAELYYAMGDYDNAITIGEEALAKEPDDQYFKDQLDKYRKAASDQASR
jgi:tetratricopeptide (TPR) repeat protein